MAPDFSPTICCPPLDSLVYMSLILLSSRLSKGALDRKEECLTGFYERLNNVAEEREERTPELSLSHNEVNSLN